MAGGGGSRARGGASACPPREAGCTDRGPLEDLVWCRSGLKLCSESLRQRRESQLVQPRQRGRRRAPFCLSHGAKAPAGACFRTFLIHHLPPGPRFLQRPYGRVDRPKLKRKLLERCVSAGEAPEGCRPGAGYGGRRQQPVAALLLSGPQRRTQAPQAHCGTIHPPALPRRAPGVKFVTDKVDHVDHAGGRSTVSTASGKAVRGSMVLDATGHSRRLVKFDQKFDPGYQVGFERRAPPLGLAV